MLLGTRTAAPPAGWVGRSGDPTPNLLRSAARGGSVGRNSVVTTESETLPTATRGSVGGDHLNWGGGVKSYKSY